MSRRVIDGTQLLARLAPTKRRGPGKGYTLAEKTRIVERNLFGGESAEVLSLEVDRSPTTLLAWCSYYRCRQDVWKGVPRTERRPFTIIEGDFSS